jgi:putative protease
MKEIGKVVHYFDKIGVAIIELKSGLKVGDTVTIGGKEEFDQEISSMQIEHEQVESAKAGKNVGTKVDQPVHEGAKVSLK